MITINNLSKNHGKKTLFEDISLTIYAGEKVGLIGPNGTGKSTLFRIILGESESSSGNASIIKNTRIGYLPQESKFSSKHTVLDEIMQGDQEIIELNKEKEKLEKSNQTDTARYGDILHTLEVYGFFDLEHKAKKNLSGLGFKETDFNRPIEHLSGGWQMRVLLAKLLTCHYDVLLLDEPTNYLDLNAALWFKDYLASYQGTFLMISHDKSFLNEVTNYTLILEQAKMIKIKGNYEQYQIIREEKMITLKKQFVEQEKKIKQLKAFIQRFHAQPNKASQVRSKKRVLEKMEKVELLANTRDSIRTFKFPKTTPSGHHVIALNNVSKSYGDLSVYEDIDFEIMKGERAVLIGDNGAGKSTLLKILAGVIDVDCGKRKLGHNVNIGYFSQTRMDVLDPEKTVIDEAYSAAQSDMKPEALRTLLAIFLFTGDDIDKRVSVLSGGEKSRLIMAKLLLSCPNFLVLDEPTTHLDVDAVDALVKALTEYEGTIVFISHDIHFVRSVANNVYHVRGGYIKKYPGEFDYYLEKSKEDGFLEKELPPRKRIKKIISTEITPKAEKNIDEDAVKIQNENLSKKYAS